MIDAERLLETFLTILRINSFHPHEDEVIAALRPRLERAGMTLTADEHRNVLGYLPGKGARASAEPILLNAHTDTVRPTEGMQPVVREGAVHSNGASVLGADDKAGVAAIVEAVEAVAASSADHGPIEVLLTVGEDVGHIGSQAFDIGPVRSKMAFVLDCTGPVGEIVVAAPWSRKFRAVFTGLAAHAGIEPEKGRSALEMAARAIETMPLGRIDEETTANIGIVRGGDATNIVAPRAELTANTRSLNAGKVERQLAAMIECCQRGAADFDGSVEVDIYMKFDGYRFSPGDPIVQRAQAAISAVELTPRLTVTGGGSDANQLNAKGLPSLVLAVGYHQIHTNQEWMPLDELNRLAKVCVALILDRYPPPE